MDSYKDALDHTVICSTTALKSFSVLTSPLSLLSTLKDQTTPSPHQDAFHKRHCAPCFGIPRLCLPWQEPRLRDNLLRRLQDEVRSRQLYEDVGDDRIQGQTYNLSEDPHLHRCSSKAHYNNRKSHQGKNPPTANSWILTNIWDRLKLGLLLRRRSRPSRSRPTPSRRSLLPRQRAKSSPSPQRKSLSPAHDLAASNMFQGRFHQEGDQDMAQDQERSQDRDQVVCYDQDQGSTHH